MKLSKYRANPDGSLNEKNICVDNACVLGKWIYGDGKNYSSSRLYEPLRLAHAHFHKTAASVIENINSKNIKQADIILAPNGTYSNASDNCVELIKRLKAEVQGSVDEQAA